MKNVIFVFFAIGTMLMASCKKVDGDGPVVTEDRTVTGFSGLDLRVSGDVYFTRDSVFKVELSAQQNILDRLETFVSNNRLVIKAEHDVQFRSYEPIKILVSGPDLNVVRISGSGNIATTNAVSATAMDIDVSGSGNVTLIDVSASSLTTNISGSGNIKIKAGAIPDVVLKISGSGNTDLSNVAAQKAKTTTSGSGDIRLNVSQELDVTISGSGSVYYIGNPVIDTHISGSGNVSHM